MWEWGICRHFLSKSLYKSNNQDNKHSRKDKGTCKVYTRNEHATLWEDDGTSAGSIDAGSVPAPPHQQVELAEHLRLSVQPSEFASMNQE
jgi:hypothetical protein